MSPPDQPKPTGERFVMKDHMIFDTDAYAFIGAGDACYLLNESNAALPAPQGAQHHMEACRALLNVPDDEVLYDAIEELLSAEAVRSIESMTRVQQQVNDQAVEIQQLKEQLAAAQAAMKSAHRLFSEDEGYDTADVIVQVGLLFDNPTDALDAALAAERSKYESFVPLGDQIAIAQQPLIDALKQISTQTVEPRCAEVAKDALANVGAYPLPDGRTK